VKTYSVDEVVEMFGGRSDSWLREGVRQRKFPHLRVGRSPRFTDEHVAAIKQALEVPVAESPAEQPTDGVDLSVFGATNRSIARHRNRRAS
jgi:hypothetical protein